MPPIGTIIRVTKLINFRGDLADFISNGMAHECRRARNRRWYITGNYTYL